MAIHVPMPELPLSGLNRAINTGNSMFTAMMTPVLERERQRQLERHFQEEMAYKRARAAHADAASKAANDPMAALNDFRMIQKLLGQQGGHDGQQQQDMPSQEMGQGMGMFTPDGLQGAQQQAQAAPGQGDMGHPDEMELLKQVLGAQYKKKHGFNPFGEHKESAQEKREADYAFKNKAIEQKEIASINKDLPTLEKSLKGVNQLLAIAKNNPDMFGHGVWPDLYAKVSKNKNFGTWQNLISDAIAGLEQKLSSKGNIVALKMAGQLKPSHADQQQVAIGKLESMKQQLEDSVNNSRQRLGKEKAQKYQDDDLVVVEGPNGDETMTYAKAKKLGAM